VERLLFVRRARALGLPLRRLRALSAALDGGPRSALRPRLLGVVREQLEAVRRRMSELQRLRDQLEGVAERLAASRGPGGADGCRCLDAAGAG
jgi:DNA-binding transcriptional MerR regulator